MPRLPSGSYVKELDLLNATETLLLLEDLLKHNINEVKLLLEPCTMEIELNNNVHTIAVGSPALILGQEQVISNRSISFYKLVKDAWAEYTVVNLQALILFLRAVIQGESTSVNNTRLEIHDRCPDCSYLYPLERLLLKYPCAHNVDKIDFNLLESLYRDSMKENKIVLLACITREQSLPYVWLKISGNDISINTCRPDPKRGPGVIGSLIDAFLYALSGRARG